MRWVKATGNKKPKAGERVVAKILYKSKTHKISYIGVGWAYIDEKHKLVTSDTKENYSSKVIEWLDEDSPSGPSHDEIEAALQLSGYDKDSKEEDAYQAGFLDGIEFIKEEVVTQYNKWVEDYHKLNGMIKIPKESGRWTDEDMKFAAKTEFYESQTGDICTIDGYKVYSPKYKKKINENILFEDWLEKYRKGEAHDQPKQSAIPPTGVWTDTDMLHFAAWIMNSEYTEDMGEWFLGVFRPNAPAEYNHVEERDILNEYRATKPTSPIKE